MAVALAKLRADEQLRESEGRLRLAQHVASIGTFDAMLKRERTCGRPSWKLCMGSHQGDFKGQTPPGRNLSIRKIGMERSDRSVRPLTMGVSKESGVSSGQMGRSIGFRAEGGSSAIFRAGP